MNGSNEQIARMQFIDVGGWEFGVREFRRFAFLSISSQHTMRGYVCVRTLEHHHIRMKITHKVSGLQTGCIRLYYFDCPDVHVLVNGSNVRNLRNDVVV